jgi:GT2 family glycosyltransferase
VDDASSDGTAEYLSRAFPSVEVLRLKKSGFGRAVNSGVLQAQTEAVVLLNNDVVVEPRFLKNLLEGLQEPEVFAVGAKFLSGEGKLEHVLGNRTRAVWKKGLLEISHETNPAHLTARGPQFYAQGGGMACRRQRFIDLGGFDTLYEPFYWEDVDLSYRAWKRGWKVLYEPGAVCRHYQSQTTERDYRARYLKLISLRNSYLFHWKNVIEKRLLARHLACIPRRVAGDTLLGGEPVEFSAFIAALNRLRHAAARRAVERSFAAISDSEAMRRGNG